MRTVSADVRYKRPSSSFTSFAISFPGSTRVPRMNSRVEKTRLDFRCSHCAKRITWAWLIQYHSYQYTQLVYLCSECEQVIKIENAPKVPKSSTGFPDPRSQKRK
jgi:hypothetical protein